MNDGVMGAVNGAMPSLSFQPVWSHARSEISTLLRWSQELPEYEIRKQRHEPSRHNFPNHLILFKFPHALLALVDQNEAKRRAFPWLFYCTKSSVLHLRKRVGNWGFASLSQGYLKLAAILQLVLFPAFNRYNCLTKFSKQFNSVRVNFIFHSSY